MILKTFTKQPADVKDYDVRYADWLGEMTDTLVSVAIPVVTCLTDSADTALVVDSTSVTSDTLKLWMSGGTAGATYKVSFVVTTAGGREDQSELKFNVRDY